MYPNPNPGPGLLLVHNYTYLREEIEPSSRDFVLMLFKDYGRI